MDPLPRNDAGTDEAVKEARKLLGLLRQQRHLLLGTDAASADALERGTRELGNALAAFGSTMRGSATALDSATATSLRQEVVATQAMLTGLAAGNRRALAALFGEPQLYGGF
jgi:hypothetical protein